MIETFKTILAQKEKPLGGICRFAFAKGKRQYLKPEGIEALGRRRLRKDKEGPPALGSQASRRGGARRGRKTTKMVQ